MGAFESTAYMRTDTMADILTFRAKDSTSAPNLERLPQFNMAVVAMVGDEILAAVNTDHLDALTETQLFAVIGRTQHLVTQLGMLAEERLLRGKAK